MGSIARGFPLASGILLTIAAVNASAQAKTFSASETARIGACIKAASRGALWLERTLWGLRDQEGGWIGAEVSNTNGTQDFGPFQINSWWLPKIANAIVRPDAQIRHWLKFDPCFNVEAARWIFLSGLSVTGDYWKALGMYHSPTDWRQRRYALSVSNHLRRRFGKDIFIRQTYSLKKVP